MIMNFSFEFSLGLLFWNFLRKLTVIDILEYFLSLNFEGQLPGNFFFDVSMADNVTFFFSNFRLNFVHCCMNSTSIARHQDGVRTHSYSYLHIRTCS